MPACFQRAEMTGGQRRAPPDPRSPAPDSDVQPLGSARPGLLPGAYSSGSQTRTQPTTGQPTGTDASLWVPASAAREPPGGVGPATLRAPPPGRRGSHRARPAPRGGGRSLGDRLGCERRGRELPPLPVVPRAAAAASPRRRPRRPPPRARPLAPRARGRLREKPPPTPLCALSSPRSPTPPPPLSAPRPLSQPALARLPEPTSPATSGEGTTVGTESHTSGGDEFSLRSPHDVLPAWTFRNGSGLFAASVYPLAIVRAESH